MDSFSLDQEALLCLSVAANAMFLLHLLVSRLVELTIYLLRGRCWVVTYMGEINRTRPGLVARVYSEHLVLWALVILVIVCLRYTSSVTSHPFIPPITLSQQRSELDLLVRVVLYVTLIRSAFLAGRLVFSKDIHVLQDHAKSRTSFGPTGNTKADFVYSLVDSGVIFVNLTFRQNVFLSITSPFFELNSTALDVYRLVELLRLIISSQTIKNVTILNVIMCVLCRLVLPVVFLLIALLNQSPFEMDALPLVCFFTSGIFRLVFHIHSIYQSILLFKRPPPELLPLPQSKRTRPPSGPPKLDALSNDIHEENGSDKEKSSPEGLPLFRRFNYLFIRSYDNRNLACVVGNEGSEKMNILKRKEVSKNSLLYKPRRCEESSFHTKDNLLESKELSTNQLDMEMTTDESLLGSPLEEYRLEVGPSGDVNDVSSVSEPYFLDVQEYG